MECPAQIITMPFQNYSQYGCKKLEMEQINPAVVDCKVMTDGRMDEQRNRDYFIVPFTFLQKARDNNRYIVKNLLIMFK